MVLVGPSGCGKTTALRMVAGLEDISEGALRIGDRVVNHVPSRDRDIAMVFQSYALYPHLSVYDNIAFGLRIKKLPKSEIERRVGEAARILGLERVAEAQAARALRRPAAARRDGAGDRARAVGVPDGRAAFESRRQATGPDARRDLAASAELGVTTIYVTHDQVEAMTMGDRVAVMRKGELQQVADPQTLYDRPLNLFVGGFIGSPAMNMLEATVSASNGGMTARSARSPSTFAARRSTPIPRCRRTTDAGWSSGIRPEDLEDAALAGDAPAGRLSGTVELTRGARLGDHGALRDRREAGETDEMLELAEDTGDDRAPQHAADADGSAVSVASARGRRCTEGDARRGRVDTRALHFFDPETGLGIYDKNSTKGAARESHTHRGSGPCPRARCGRRRAAAAQDRSTTSRRRAPQHGRQGRSHSMASGRPARPRRSAM